MPFLSQRCRNIFHAMFFSSKNMPSYKVTTWIPQKQSARTACLKKLDTAEAHHQSPLCRSPWNTWKFVDQVRQHSIYVCVSLYINQKNLITSVKIRISGRQPCQINANSAIPFKCPVYSESESIDKQSRGLTDRDRGWRGWENIFSILLGFKLAPSSLSLFVLGSKEAAKLGGNNYASTTREFKQLN